MGKKIIFYFDNVYYLKYLFISCMDILKRWISDMYLSDTQMRKDTGTQTHMKITIQMRGAETIIK